MEGELHRSPAHDEDSLECETEGNGTRQQASEFNSVVQGQDFAGSTRTLYRENKSEMSGISIEKPTVEGSPTDQNIKNEKTGKAVTSSAFPERLKKLW